jgi:hypothetical protein
VGLEQSISLRDAGLLVARWRKSTEKIASGKLLSLLKAGQIVAGFRFPGSTVWWIKIPTRYWNTVSNDEFRVIRFSRERKTSGAYKVRPGMFADEIVAQISQQRAPTSEEWKAALEATTRRYEVEIIERELTDFLARNADYSAQILSERKSKSGRHEKTGWRELSVIIGAYILKHYELTNERIKIKDASDIIYKIAREAGKGDLPATSTIKDVLSRICSQAETLSIN